MAITNELESMKKLESAGFSHEQASAVVEVVESGMQRGFERFTEVLDARFNEMRGEIREMEGRLKLEIQTTRADLLKEQRDQMLRFAGLVTIIFAVIGAVYRFF